MNREDFPILNTGIVYLDSSCMTLRPVQVINKIKEYYEQYPACAGRSMHSLGNKITEEVHLARKEIRKFISAKRDENIIFTRNTTEGLNIIANSFPFQKGDKILITDKEHNSNLLPWQIMAEKGLIQLEVLDSLPDNTFDLENFKEKVQGARMVSLVHTSNLDGVTNPLKDIVKIAHKNNCLVTVDAAQSIPHKDMDVGDVDFLVFSGHKMCGPSGIGALYGKTELLKKLSPFLVGGETVKSTTYTSRVWEDLPERFEAGLQNYAGILGFAESARYLKKIGLKKIEKHELKLNKQLTDAIQDINGLKIIGPEAAKRGGITSFTVPGDVHQVALLMDNMAKIMMRSGQHCVHSWFNKHKIEGSVRASLYLYNNEEDVEKFATNLKEVVKMI